MKDSRLKIDGNLIDDLVTGQLTGERYRAALRALDAEPAKWRECALAFLEEQALRSELRALVQGDINWSDDDVSVEILNPAVTSTPLTSTSDYWPSNQKRDERVAGSPQWSNLSFRTILSTAALLLVSFTVGWLGSEVAAERSQYVDSANLPLQPSNPASVVNSQAAPQYVIDRAGSFDRGIPRTIRDLERKGRISVESYDLFMPTTMEDGSSAVIPIQELRLGRGTLVSF